jgi:radical SAM superfamily enzyme YgiQ (UPF0313 family)
MWIDSSSNNALSGPARNVILVDFPWMRDKDPRVPLGHASLLATLAQNPDINCHSLVRPMNDEFDFSFQEVWNEIEILISTHRGRHLDVAIGAYVWAEELIQKLLPKIRQSLPEGRIILGGPQISYCSEGLEEIYPECDIFIRGYGEMALLSILSEGVNREIPGVHYAGEMDQNLQTTVDLNLLPSPFLSGLVPLHQGAFLRWESQRGCPFSCSFCQHKEAGAKLRKKEFCSERIFAEIDLFCEMEVGEIAILDPIFNASSQAISILQRFQQNNFDGRLSIQCRAEMITEAFIQSLDGLDVKLEFGLQTIHKKEGQAVNRNNNMEKVHRGLNMVNEAGIEFELSIIFGLPDQTIESFIETVDWCLSSGATAIKAFPLMLLRGTELEERKEEWGLVESLGTMPVVLSSNSYSIENWQSMGKISQALKMTEGHHPLEVSELLSLGKNLTVDMPRFRPNLIDNATASPVPMHGALSRGLTS